MAEHELRIPGVSLDRESLLHGLFLAKWHVADGDTVAAGEPLFELEMLKAAADVESPYRGVLRHAIAANTRVGFDQVVGWIKE